MKQTTIKPVENYPKMVDGEVVTRATAVDTGLTGNTHFANLPVDLTTLKAGIDSLSALMAEARDGSKKVIAQKNNQREAVIQMLRLLGRHVQVNCNGDMAIFKSSGFEPVSSTKAKPQGVSDFFRGIDHGENSGQIVVRLKAVPKAFSYELRFAAVVNGAPSSVWTTQPVAITRTPAVVTGLTPGTIYAFQVRSLTQSGFSDWSDSVTLMCM
jgi:hypothetical protein